MSGARDAWRGDARAQGSFGSDGSFAVYRPAERRVEMSGVQLE